MARFFEKISFDQFKKDIADDEDLYKGYTLPRRNTKHSAGYDFCAVEGFVIEPGEIKKIPLGLKVRMNPDEVLLLFIRSSQGFKYNVRMCNQVGVIDCDFYNNPDNEGHFWIRLQNEGDKPYVVQAGDKICQGIFMKYLVVDDEDEVSSERIGGIGSTDNK